ncbi:MAG: hypothetical protein QXF56_04585 [Candidatus Micrarchaeia archaeon]
MIGVKYGWFSTYLYIQNEDIIKLAEEFKLKLYSHNNAVITDSPDKADASLKRLYFMTILTAE